MPSWYLDDADPLAAEYKYTFYKPSREVIAKVKVGECVKLIFRFDSDDPNAPGVERMWVVVDTHEETPGRPKVPHSPRGAAATPPGGAFSEGGRFQGRLDNDPRYIQDLKAEDPIEFEACHIIATEHDDGGGLVERYIKRCFVTQGVLRDGARVGYLYRESPDEDKDSGWRFSVGDESDDYMDTADNIAYVSIGAVLARDDSFIHLLDSPSGCAFARDPATGAFVAVRQEAT
jgi:hypothetical protein